MTSAASRVAARYLKKSGRLQDPEKMTPDDAIEAAEKLKEEIEDKIKDLMEEVHEAQKRWSTAQRAFDQSNWSRLEIEAIISEEDRDFLQKVHGLYDWA